MPQVTDPAVLAQLNGSPTPARAPSAAGLTPVTDPKILAQLNAPEAVSTAPTASPPTWRNYLHDFESGVLSGGAYLAGMVPDVLANVGTLGIAGYDVAKHAMGTPWAELPRPYEPNITGASISRLLNRSPVTETTMQRPDSPASRALYTAGSLIPGAAAFGGGTAGGTARAFAGALPSAAAGQSVLEAQPFEEEWKNVAASGLAQLGVSYGLPAINKWAIRGSDPEQLQENLAAFHEAGAEPSLGQAAGTRRMRFLETALAKIPGGSGILSRFAGEQAGGLREGAESVVSGLSHEVGPEAAGEALIRGIKGPGGAVERFTQQSEQLFSDVGRYIPGSKPVPVTNTLSTLEQLTSPVPGATATSDVLVNPKIAAYRSSLQADVGKSGVLPYEALSGLRTKVGAQLKTNELVSGVPRGELKLLYGALTDDMRAAAQAQGPEATAAFEKAQGFYREGRPVIKQLEGIAASSAPEQAYRSAISGTQYGASRLRMIMGAIPVEDRNAVAATVLDRMGRATPGQQNAEGTVYSPQTFLTNWNRMSPDARTVLFGPPGSGLREHLENTAAVAANIKAGSSVFANPSGTAPAQNQSEIFKNLVTLGAGALLGAGGGISGAAVAAVGVPTAANIGARAVTSPLMMQWAGQPSFGSASQAATATQMPSMMANYQRLRQALGMGALDLQQ